MSTRYFVIRADRNTLDVHSGTTKYVNDRDCFKFFESFCKKNKRAMHIYLNVLERVKAP